MSYQVGDRVLYQGCVYSVVSCTLESETAVMWKLPSRGDAYNLYKIEHCESRPHTTECLLQALVWEHEIERINQ